MSEPLPHDDHNALPVGVRLGEFEIRRVLGSGGFGIVYVAFDHALEREVAIKEYMPAALAGRSATHHVTVLSRGHAETFALGLRSFVNEAKLLARFDHPSLVKVLRFWEEHGTAYMAMPFYKGSTLKVLRQGMSAPPSEAWLRKVCEALLGALEAMHREGVYHRDISPDNIVVDEDGRPVLLDFGAARRVINDKSQALTAILKPNYAPIEQYAESAGLRQGPWTDLYALGATLHYLVTGQPPTPATARALADERLPLQHQSVPGLSPTLLALVDWMLAPRPENRPRDVAQVRAALAGRLDIPATPLPAAPAEASDDQEWPATELFQRTEPPPRRRAPVAPPAPADEDEDPDATIVRPSTWRPTAMQAAATPAPAHQRSPLLSPSITAGPLPVPSAAPASPAPPRVPVPQAEPPEPPAPAPVAAPARAEPPPEPAEPTPPAPAQAPRRSALPLVAGVALVLAAVAAYLVLGRSAAPEGAAAPLAAASAASTPVAAASAPSAPSAAADAVTIIGAPAVVPAAASAVPAPLEAPAPAPAAAVPSPAPAGTAAATATPAALASAPAGAKPPKGAASRPQAGLARNAPASANAAVATTTPTAPAAAAEPAPAPASRAAAPAPAPAAAAEPERRDPNEACAGRMLLALHRCLLRECARPEVSQHPACARVREIERRSQEQTQY